MKNQNQNNNDAAATPSQISTLAFRADFVNEVPGSTGGHILLQPEGTPRPRLDGNYAPGKYYTGIWILTRDGKINASFPPPYEEGAQWECFEGETIAATTEAVNAAIARGEFRGVEMAARAHQRIVAEAKGKRQSGSIGAAAVSDARIYAARDNSTFAIGAATPEAMLPNLNYAPVREGTMTSVTNDDGEVIGSVQFAEKIKLPVGRVKGKGELVQMYVARGWHGCILSSLGGTYKTETQAREAVHLNYQIVCDASRIPAPEVNLASDSAGAAHGKIILPTRHGEHIGYWTARDGAYYTIFTSKIVGSPYINFTRGSEERAQYEVEKSIGKAIAEELRSRARTTAEAKGKRKFASVGAAAVGDAQVSGGALAANTDDVKFIAGRVYKDGDGNHWRFDGNTPSERYGRFTILTPGAEMAHNSGAGVVMTAEYRCELTGNNSPRIHTVRARFLGRDVIISAANSGDDDTPSPSPSEAAPTGNETLGLRTHLRQLAVSGCDAPREVIDALQDKAGRFDADGVFTEFGNLRAWLDSAEYVLKNECERASRTGAK